MKNHENCKISKLYRSILELDRKTAFLGTSQETANFGPGRHFREETPICLYSVNFFLCYYFQEFTGADMVWHW
jgi:hypothetical protein